MLKKGGERQLSKLLPLNRSKVAIGGWVDEVFLGRRPSTSLLYLLIPQCIMHCGRHQNTVLIYACIFRTNFSHPNREAYFILFSYFLSCVCSMAVFVWLDTVRVESIHIYLVRRSSVPFRILNQLSNVDKFPFKRLMPFYLSVVYAPKSMCGGPSKYLLHNSPRVVSAQ